MKLVMKRRHYADLSALDLEDLIKMDPSLGYFVMACEEWHETFKKELDLQNLTTYPHSIYVVKEKKPWRERAEQLLRQLEGHLNPPWDLYDTDAYITANNEISRAPLDIEYIRDAITDQFGKHGVELLLIPISVEGQLKGWLLGDHGDMLDLIVLSADGNYFSGVSALPGQEEEVLEPLVRMWRALNLQPPPAFVSWLSQLGES